MNSISRTLGMALGKIDVETPKYEVITTTADYEIRKYPAAVIAEVTYDPADYKSNKDGGIFILADYIGVYGEAQNVRPEPIAMTAPVVTKSSGEMITMGFILPSKYSTAEDAPQPLDERVMIRGEDAKKYAVVWFSGVARENVVAEKVKKLRACLERDGYKIAGDFVLGRYNPPFTLPPLRTNEVIIPIA